MTTERKIQEKQTKDRKMSRARRILLLKRKLLLLKICMVLLLTRTHLAGTEKKSFLNFKKRRRIWVRKVWQTRKLEGAYNIMLRYLHENDAIAFQRFLHMTPTKYSELLDMLKKHLKKNPWGRPALSPGHRLAITLRFLTSGDSFASISYTFRVGFATSKRIIYETCEVLWNFLQPLYMPMPTKERWIQISKGYNTMWNFPACLGTLNAQQVVLQPQKAGCPNSLTNKPNPIIFLTLVDAHYNFIAMDVGTHVQSIEDGNFLKNSPFGKDLEEGRLDLPADTCLPMSTVVVPHVFLGNESFQLQQNILTPFPHNEYDVPRTIFNARHSHARRCGANALGNLVSKFRVFRQPLNVHPKNVEKIIRACVVLHNFLRSDIPDEAYCPDGFTDHIDSAGNIINGLWRSSPQIRAAAGLQDLPAVHNSHPSFHTENTRTAFVHHFAQQGQISWQWDEAANIPPVYYPCDPTMTV